MGGDAEPGGCFHFGSEFGEQGQFRVDDHFTCSADQVGMWIGSAAVVAVAAITGTYFQNLPDIFEQMDGFVNRGQTGRREVDSNLRVNLLDTGMVRAAEEDFKDSDPLRSDAAVPLPQLGQDAVKTVLPGLHDQRPLCGMATP